MTHYNVSRSGFGLLFSMLIFGCGCGARARSAGFCRVPRARVGPFVGRGGGWLSVSRVGGGPMLWSAG